MKVAIQKGSARASSGTQLRSDLMLLADAALQVIAASGGALVVCDAELRVLAASAAAATLAGIEAGGSLPEEIARIVTEPGEGSGMVRTSRGGAVAVRVRPLDGMHPAVLALVVEEAAPPEPTALHSLTSSLGLNVRERQLVALLRRGMSNREIASSLKLTEGTVKTYLYELFAKLRVESRMQLVARVDQLLSQRNVG